MLLPISICLFTSTKGHWGSKDLYKSTLSHLDRQIPLSTFAVRYAHIKVGINEEKIEDEMVTELQKYDFIIDCTSRDWSRGISHQQEYLLDMRKASKNIVLQSQPYLLIQEDDSPIICHTNDLKKTLYMMTKFLDDPDIVSSRFLRASDLFSSPILRQEKDYFFSPHFNFQPSILRSRDFFIANRIIENNWATLSHLQCELVMRLALNQLTRSEFSHIVWNPSYAETIHLGVENYKSILESLKI